MISFDEAYEVVMDRAVNTATESVALADSSGRVLAEDVVSDINMPPFDKSAMDGYACRREDLSNPLDVIEIIPAGAWPKNLIGPNQFSKIMTGAPAPEGADCVIMIEHTEMINETSIRFVEEETKGNICFQGEDVQVGDVVLMKGARVLPQHVAVMAGVGCAQPLVFVRPRVGVISTGSELVVPDAQPDKAQIRDSNSGQLTAQVQRMGAVATNYGIAIDTEEAIDTVFKKAVSENDVVILSGGVSVGDFDLAPEVLKKNGIELLFDEVAIQPGRPSTFGVGESVRVFGLPGNPVSTFVQFEMLLKPFLFKMMGCEARPTTVQAILDVPLKRKRASRTSVIPVEFTQPGHVTAIDYHGSAHIAAMCRTQGFVLFPKDLTYLEKGTLVDARLLQS